MANSANVQTQNSIGIQRATSTAAAAAATAAQHSAVSLKDMRMANVRRNVGNAAHNEQSTAAAGASGGCGDGGGGYYYTTTAVLPMAETFPTAKRLQHKYTITGGAGGRRIGGSGGVNPPPLGVSQALRVQKPTVTVNESAGDGGGGGGSSTSALSVTAYTQRTLQALLRKHTIACSWRRSSGGGGSGGSHWWRWSLCGGVSVLLLCMIAYFVWLRGLPHGVAMTMPAAVAKTETITAFTSITTTSSSSTTERPVTRATTLAYTPHRTNALNAHAANAKADGVTAWPKASQQPHEVDQEQVEEEEDWYDEGLLEPNESVEAAAAVQNLTVLRLQPLDNRLHDEHENTSPAGGGYTHIVSPTLPPLRHWSTASAGGNNTPTPTTAATPNATSSGCRSTALPMCQGVLDYDLTSGSAASTAQLSADERIAFQMLAHSNCSARALEFVCTVLEPECRSAGVILPPCRRICKAIREACSIVVPSSDVLTAIFDCSAYPDSNAPDECDDPTRRRDYCYENEFACEDRSCIPHQWQCDNIKDCAAGDDEERCLLCEQPDEFRCRSNEKCVTAAQRCDQREDCFDGSDERNCEDFLYSDEFALDTFYPTDGVGYNDADAPSALLAKYNELLQASATFNRSGSTSSDGAGDADGHAVKEDISNIVTSESKAQGFVHFRDSKEIMMTSDTENKFKYSSTTRGNRTYSNASNNKTNGTNVNVTPTVSPTSPPPTATATTTTPTTRRTASSVGSVCAPHQLRCVSGHCITVQQICDKKIDCPDGADELMCVYKQRNGVTANANTAAAAATTSTASSNSSTSSNTTTTSSSTNTTTTQRQPHDAKRKTTIRKLRGQYQQQQQHQQQQSHG